MSKYDAIRVTCLGMSDLEKIRSQAKTGTATTNLKTGEITHSFSSESPPLSHNGPQGIGFYDPDTGEVKCQLFFGNVQKPVRGEVYRWHSEFDPYFCFYVQFQSWYTIIKQKTRLIICPGFDFRFQGRMLCNLHVIQQSVKHSITPRLGVIYDEDERVMAKALIKLAHQAWPVSARGQFKLTEYGLANPSATIDWKGVDKWRVVACSLWGQWRSSKATWEARAADVREHCPGVKMTAERLRRECAKDRLGLLV